MKITVETLVHAPLAHVWQTWSNPTDMKQWNAAQDDWHTPYCTIDLREGGEFLARMEAKDGSAGFDFGGVYTKVEPQKTVEYRMGDGREVEVNFIQQADGVLVTTTFDAETVNAPERQRQGWQAILDNFGRYAEAKR